MIFITQIFILSVILFYPIYANAEVTVQCLSDEKNGDCFRRKIDVLGSNNIDNRCNAEEFDKSDTYKISNDVLLLKSINEMASGAYNHAYCLFLFDKIQNTVSYLGTYSGLSFYGDGKIFSDFMKGRGLADIGSIEFYEIDLMTKKVNKITGFFTHHKEIKNKIYWDKYVDENGKNDKDGGYLDRAARYTKKQKLERLNF